MKNFTVTLFKCVVLTKIKSITILAENTDEAIQLGTKRLHPKEGQEFVGAEPSKG